MMPGCSQWLKETTTGLITSDNTGINQFLEAVVSLIFWEA